jgi:tetratricopeptide (TPR) repeat protein
MFVSTATAFVLAAATTAAAVPPPASPAPAVAPAVAPATAPDTLPDEAIVLGLRRARLAEIVGDNDLERKVLDELVASYPADPTALTGALEFYRRTAPGSETTRSLESRLVAALSAPDQVFPIPLIADIARDPSSSPEELERLAAILSRQPSRGADHVDRLRLRVAILDRLGRADDVVAALVELSKADQDPTVVMELRALYAKAGKWEDVLRTVDRLPTEPGWIDPGWYRLEAYGALGRFDDLEKEADALLGRLTSSKVAVTTPTKGLAGIVADPATGAGARRVDARVAAAFFPVLFQLLDAGHREPAEHLLGRLDEQTGHAESVHRMRVMLFGTAAERTAYLEASAKATLGSGDESKIRAEADKRLLEKDYRTAYDLFRHLVLANSNAFSSDVSGWFNYGLSAAETEHWDEVDTAMTRVLALDPKMSRAFAQRARARIMQKQFAEGISDAQAALAIDPASRQAFYAMYLAYQTQGDTEKAQVWLRRFKAP